MNLLGIETSCDETAAAVVRDGREVLSDVVASQQEIHRRFGGVVPEVACRAHIESITPVLEEAMHRAGLGFDALDAIAVTQAPGLVGALLIGLASAKALAWRLRRPLIPVNHIEAHIYANALEGHAVEFPAIALVVSGGHTLLYRCASFTDMRMIGSTTDDAAGEAFDKVAAILRLGYPGGPIIDRCAAAGNPSAIAFPRTFLSRERLDFSFSGLKTAVLYHVRGQNAAKQETPPLSSQEISDICASFQEAVVDVLLNKTFRASEVHRAKCIVLGGGVACNSRLRARFREMASKKGIPVFQPSLKLCTDNAAMIGGLGYHLLQAGREADLSLDANPTPLRTVSPVV